MQTDPDTRIGITTTIPIEVIYAAGAVPVDLNNVFINGSDPQAMVEQAELDGYPRNICAWIKGIYSTALQQGIRRIVAVTQGDCSNTCALMETLVVKGLEVIPFAYPYDADCDMLSLQIEKLMVRLGVRWNEVRETKACLDDIRGRVHRIDRLTWEEDRVSGFDNHYYQVSCSDMNGDPDAFRRQCDDFLKQAESAEPRKGELRLAYVGVPPIVSDIYGYLEGMGARVVYNEVQRQFSFPRPVDDLIEQYRRFTYPYGIFRRLEDIKLEIARRRADAVIHYTQSFCFRQIEDLILQQELNLPVLALEGENPGPLDARSRMRIDSFIEMLRAGKVHR
ncbi:MAG: 2-hydroxyacyl-CoA dehydratase [bacterium]|nr:2-hydroxyacyl-CoA dehydratase [bacterium]